MKNSFVVNKQKDDFTLKGKVSDEQGGPLPGASLVLVGSTRGVVTDLDGTFSIIVSRGDKLLVSFLGMEDQIITVVDDQELNIILRDKGKELEELTVVAFAKQKKESVVSSISTIAPDELQVPSSNLTTAFAGRLAGVISYQRSGEPGEDNASFFIRGVTSFGAGKKDPLILIDGVELTSNDLARLNTDDIESFSILKDASATALYGARGANGVIMVKTKEGAEGKAKLSIRIENSLSEPVSTIKLVKDPQLFMNLHNEAVKTRDPLGALIYSDEKIAKTGTGNPYVYPFNDWQEMLFKDYTNNQRVNMNISGGGNIARYYIAASMNQDNGILKVDKRNNFNSNINLTKYLLRGNMNINVTPSTEVVFRLHGTFDDYTGPIDGGTAVYNSVLKTNPVLFPAYFEPDDANIYTTHILFGNYGSGNYINPYADMVKGYKEYNKTLVLAQLELKQDLNFLLKGLSLRGMFNTTRYSYFDVARYYNPYFYSMGFYNKSTDKYFLTPLNEASGTEYLTYSEGEKSVYSTTYFEGAMQYATTVQELHNLNALFVLTSYEKRVGNSGSLQLSLPYRNLGLAGRLTYDFDTRYFLEWNFGYNGSERFSKKNRFGFFPSIAAGYLLSNEIFFEPLKKVISKLKLKASYGLVGNDEIGDPDDRFFYLSEVNMNNSSRGYTFGNERNYSKNGVSISRYADPYITWEKSYKQNYGIELSLFEKIEIQGDYFREHRTNILQERSYIPSTMGLQASPQANIGEVSGQGIEFSLNYSQFFNNDLWATVMGNFTYATAKYLVYEEPSYEATPWIRREGQKIGQSWGLIAERLFIDEYDVENSPFQEFGDYNAGDIKYKDINKDGVINSYDRVPIGFPTTPEIVYGFGASLGYKNFDFSFFFQGSGRSSFFISPGSITPFVNNQSLLEMIAEDYWSEDNRNVYAFWPRLSNYTMTNNNQQSTHWLRNGSFLRLKTVETGYTFPKRWTDKIFIQNARLYLSGSNLFVLSPFKDWDVEMAGNGFGYPLQRVINIGLNINF
ncbi:MAG: TonB-dependent receptor [Parabacteroides sp.]|nr:TonB-dependent receptor [Parabacteroides sp.]